MLLKPATELELQPIIDLPPVIAEPLRNHDVKRPVGRPRKIVQAEPAPEARVSEAPAEDPPQPFKPGTPHACRCGCGTILNGRNGYYHGHKPKKIAPDEDTPTQKNIKQDRSIVIRSLCADIIKLTLKRSEIDADIQALDRTVRLLQRL